VGLFFCGPQRAGWKKRGWTAPTNGWGGAGRAEEIGGRGPAANGSGSLPVPQVTFLNLGGEGIFIFRGVLVRGHWKEEAGR